MERKLSHAEIMERYGEAVVSPEEASAPVYPYVYVTSEGLVHELDDEDRAYLEERFHPMDSARPATRSAFMGEQGRAVQGFCHRSLLPAGTIVNSDPIMCRSKFASFRRSEVTEESGGDVTGNSEGFNTVGMSKKKPWWRFWES